MFLKKSLLFMTALALLMFTGQASAQPSVSLTHVPGEGGTEGVVAGQGTTFTVKISQTGVNDIPGVSALAGLNIDLAFDASKVSLTNSGPLLQGTLEGGIRLTLFAFPPGQPLTVPDSADLTFTTAADYDGSEFTISITGVNDGAALSLPVSATATFNKADTTDPPDPPDPPDPVDPTPPGEGVSLSSGGASIVRGVGAGDEVKVDVVVGGLAEATVAGGKITFSVDPSVATITGVIPGSSVVESESSGLTLVLAIPPMMLQGGGLGSVTFTTAANYDGGMFAIGVTSLELITTGGRMSVAPGAPVVVNKPLPTLMGPDGDVMIMPGGSATAMVTASGFDGTVTFDGAAEDGTVMASEPGEVTVTASDGIDPASASATINFVWGPLTLTASDPDPVMPGGSSSSMLTVEGAAEGAAVAITSSNEAVTVSEDGTMASASGAAEATLTATVGDAPPATADVAFVWGELTLMASDPDPVMPGGSSSSMLTVEGAAEGAMVAITSDNEAVTVSEDGTMASASGAAEATLTATVGDAPPATADVAFVWGELTLMASDADPVPPGGSSSVTLTVSGQAEGAMVAITSDNEAVTVSEDGTMASASGTAMATLTATVGDAPPATADVAFEMGAITLSADATEVAIGPDGGMAMVTASGQAEGADVVFSEGATENEDGVSATVSASSASTATVTASVGDVMSNEVTIAFMPSLQTESTMVTFDDFGDTASASVTAYGFPEGANIRFKITGGTGFATADGAGTWTVSTDRAGDVTMVAEDDMGNATAPLTITFGNPSPYLTADPESADVIIPDNGEVVVTVTATGLGDDISWTVTEVTGTATVNIDTDGATATLTGVDSDDISQTSTATLIASDGTMTTGDITITFRKMPELQPEMANVTVPQTVVGSMSQMVVANGFPPGTEIMFTTDPDSHPYLTKSQDGNVLTLTATGTVTVSVTATGGGITTAAVEVSFEQALPAAPASVVVQDQEGDNGHYVMVSFANSANHADVSQYRIYREMMTNTTMDADGNVVTTDTPVATWVPWAVIDAMDNDDEEGMTRAVVPVTDANATRWGVAAEKGMSSAEITPAGKRVFSKESVQALVQFLGMDPNLVVTEDELAEMFRPSADYIKSIIGDRKNVVFAALDPDLSVLMGDVSVPQNIRTGGHLDPIISSSITPTEGMVAAIDDTAPAMVTDVAADAETGVVTWTMSADDGGMDVVMYRGHGIVIPHVTGYLVRGGVSEDAMLDIGVVPAGSSTFQVPAQLIETLINQGVPAVLVTVTAMDGTNMTPSVPLVVELIPTRKAFVDADGNPVFVVKLDRHGAMTPLTVDFEDFIAFTMAFNTDETHENWRVFVQADLNDDKMVNFEDFILFFGSYGKEATGPAGKSLVTPVLGVNENAEFSLRLGSDRVVAGETMFVDVSLANVQALMGYGFVLHYDAEKFEFVEAMPAAEDLLLSSGGETPLLKGWPEEAGQVHVMNAIVNGSEVSGSGDIVRLVFRVLRNFEDDARFEIANGLVFDPQQLANPLAGGVLDIQTTPTEFALLQNFPNPFNPDTTIGYELAESADVTLQIYNVVGQVVRTLIAAESQSIGRYQVRWDGMDDRGTPVSSGIYFYQISAGKFQDVRKLMLLK